MPSASPPTTVAEAFARIVARQPSHVALRAQGRSCTYGELAGGAAAVCRVLPPARDDPWAAVVLLGADAIAGVAATLGVLAAGGVAVPLDSAHPPARLAEVLRHCGPTCVLTAPPLAALAREIAQAFPIVEIPAPPSSADFAVTVVDPGAPAIVCYTSGSTGDPKGVVASHRQTLARAAAAIDRYGFGPNDRQSVLHSFGNGAGNAALWRGLLSGGMLAPLRVGDVGVAQMRGWIDAEALTVLSFAPSLFRTFTASLPPDARLSSVRLLRLGGERVTPADFALFKRHFVPGARFANAYSITETSAVAVALLDHDSVVGDIVPAGLPLPGCRVRIVDADGADVPPGVTGEIVVEGPYLANGYWRTDPGDATRFAAADEGRVARLRSGDLGRLDEDGTLFVLGRRDFQVKIRGHRVELEAVEAALLDIPGVSQSAVLVVDGQTGDPTLTACVGAAPGATSEAAIRGHLATRLPPGSVPHRVVIRESLPLGVSGKVDRRRLADTLTPDRSESAVDWARQPAREGEVARIWRELLGHERFGPGDGFLAVGGDSLLAMRVLARVKKQWGVELALTAFLAAPTVADLATAVDRARSGAGSVDDAQLSQWLDEIEGTGGPPSQ
jgi:amino acid adenylation domain-containing protein